jgi:hypothetical protein
VPPRGRAAYAAVAFGQHSAAASGFMGVTLPEPPRMNWKNGPQGRYDPALMTHAAGAAFMELALAYPEVLRRLESWSGYAAVQQVLDRFPDLRVFIAGGVVRNCLLDKQKPVHDFDFFLDGPSISSALAVFAQHGELARTPFDSPRWHPIGEHGCYADLIPIRDFRPGLWPCEDIVDVLNQFDYTASALAFDLRTGDGFNPQNGLRDLARRTMRMVRFDFPEEPFRADTALTRNAILWFRVLHYATVLGLTIEPFTLEWLRAHRHFHKQQTLFTDLFFDPCVGYLDRLT